MTWYRCGGIPSSILDLPTVGTASGSIATFNTDMTENLVKCLVTITGSFTEANITRCGKNYWRFGDITASSNSVPFQLKAGTYNLSGTGSGGASVSIRFYYADNTSVVCQISGLNSYSNSVTLTADVVKINIYISAGSVVDVQLEAGSSKTTFEAYNGTTKTISFGTTITDGELDVLSGKLTNNSTTPPTVTQVSSEQIQTILSQNNIYADTGDIEVEFLESVGNSL